MNIYDKRSQRSRTAIKMALVCFYAESEGREKITITCLCRRAEISSPTFYRQYGTVVAVMRDYHSEMDVKLGEVLRGCSALELNFYRVFWFVLRNSNYYLAAVQLASSLPFERIEGHLRPLVLSFVRRGTEGRTGAGAKMQAQAETKAEVGAKSEAGTEIGAEVETEMKKLVFMISAEAVDLLRWWITEEKMDETLIAGHVEEIMRRVEGLAKGEGR